MAQVTMTGIEYKRLINKEDQCDTLETALLNAHTIKYQPDNKYVKLSVVGNMDLPKETITNIIYYVAKQISADVEIMKYAHDNGMQYYRINNRCVDSYGGLDGYDMREYNDDFKECWDILDREAAAEAAKTEEQNETEQQ